MTRKTMLATGIILAVAALIFFAARTGASPSGLPGSIVAVDPIGQRIQVVDNANIEYRFQCTESTTLTMNGFAASFNQLAPGQRVEVQYEPDTFIALQVDASSRW